VKPHWVILIVCLIMLPVECAVLLLSFAVPVTALHFGMHFAGWAWWLLFFASLAALQYLSLRLTRPYDLILWLLRRKPRPGSAG
jgi:hypothetical protein